VGSSALTVPFRLDRRSGNEPLAELDAWCDGVGPAIVDTNVISPDAPTTPGLGAETSFDIAVISWNVHGDAGQVARLVDGIRHRNLLGAPPAELVLLLQEVIRRGDDVPILRQGTRIAAPLPRTTGTTSDLRATARSLGMNLAYVPSMRNGRTQEDRGNAILSSLPFDRVDAFELPLGRQRRVGVSATVRSESPVRPQLRVVSVHFDTALLPFRGGPAHWRQRQAQALIAALGGQAVPTIIGGDLNTWWADDEPAVRELRRAYPEAIERRPFATTWRGPAGTDNRLDYLFAGGWGETVEVNLIRDRFGSDHYPIYAIVARR
jgi:endonuclease/exonuclease/phosphatase family metal-dependent hydrolase